MSLIKNLKNIFATGQKSISGGTWRTVAGSSYNTKAQQNAFTDWVFVAVSVLAETIGSLDYHVKNSKGEIIPHSLDYFLKDVAFMEALAYSYLIVGDVFILNTGTPKRPELEFLNPNKVHVTVKNEEIISYKVGTTVFSTDSIIHIKRTNIFNKTQGLSTIDKVLDWVGNSKNGTAIKNAFYRNGGTLTNVLETEYSTEDELEIIRTSFENHHRGGVNSGKTLVLPEGVKYKAPNKISDIHNSEEANADRDRILSAFRVPKHILGITESGSSKADAESKNISFYRFGVNPPARAIVSQLTKDLLQGLSKTRKENFIDFVDETPTNREIELKEIQVALGGKAHMTLNEVREREGLPAIKGGDYIDTGETTLEAEPKEVKKLDGFDKMVKSLKKSEDKPKKKEIRTFYDKTESELEIEHKNYDARQMSGSEKLAKAILKQQKEFQARVVKQLNTKKAKQSIEGLLEVDLEKEADELNNITFHLADELSGLEGALVMDTISSVPYEHGKIKAEIVDFVRINTTKYTETTVNLLSKELASGLEAGETFTDLAKRVDNVFGLGGDYRAMRIAQDTVFGASNISIREAYVQSGVVDTVVWYTAQDERVCTECGVMHGKEVGVQELFFEKGDTITRSDGTTRVNEWRDIYSAPLHSQCRCYTHAGKISV